MCFGQVANALPSGQAPFAIDKNVERTQIPQEALKAFFRYSTPLFGLHETVQNFGRPVARNNGSLSRPYAVKQRFGKRCAFVFKAPRQGDRSIGHKGHY